MSFLNLKQLHIYFIYVFVLLVFSCGNTIPFLNESKLVRPVGIEVEAIAGLKFNLKYYIQNQERIFDGYNIYISRKSIGDAEVYGIIPALNLNGTLPTLQHSPNDFDINKERTITIDVYNDAVTKFEKGVTYYFRITAHSRRDTLSLPSNEIAVVAID